MGRQSGSQGPRNGGGVGLAELVINLSSQSNGEKQKEIFFPSWKPSGTGSTNENKFSANFCKLHQVQIYLFYSIGPKCFETLRGTHFWDTLL
jgi:hypothetical protein